MSLAEIHVSHISFFFLPKLMPLTQGVFYGLSKKVGIGAKTKVDILLWNSPYSFSIMSAAPHVA